VDALFRIGAQKKHLGIAMLQTQLGLMMLIINRIAGYVIRRLKNETDFGSIKCEKTI
jgi:hypothetical protein